MFVNYGCCSVVFDLYIWCSQYLEIMCHVFTALHKIDWETGRAFSLQELCYRNHDSFQEDL